MNDDMPFDVERAAILSTAVGLARFALPENPNLVTRAELVAAVTKARGALDAAAAQTHELLRARLLERGFTVEQVDGFLDPGAAYKTALEGSEQL